MKKTRTLGEFQERGREEINIDNKIKLPQGRFHESTVFMFFVKEKKQPRCVAGFSAENSKDLVLLYMVIWKPFQQF